MLVTASNSDVTQLSECSGPVPAWKIGYFISPVSDIKANTCLMSQTTKFVYLSFDINGKFCSEQSPLKLVRADTCSAWSHGCRKHLAAAHKGWSLKKATYLSGLRVFKRKGRSPPLNAGTTSSITTIYSSIFPYINCADFSGLYSHRWTRGKLSEGFA